MRHSTGIKPLASKTIFCASKTAVEKNDPLVSVEKIAHTKSYDSATLTTSFPLTRPVFNFS